MEKISGVIFDMDGLIFDTEAVYSKMNVQEAQRFGLTGYDEAYYLTEIGLSEEAAYKKYFEDFKDVPKETIAGFIQASRDASWEVLKEKGAPLKPGVLELVTYLNEHKIPSIVASSNNRAAIEALLEKANLTHLFSDIISGDEVTHAKPHPEIVEKAVAKLRTLPSETIMLEDSVNGVRASYSAHVPVIMVPDLIAPDDEVKEKAYRIESDLFDVLNFIKNN
ncbi:MAG: HAD family hydrolase [Vagococcus sp.]